MEHNNVTSFLLYIPDSEMNGRKFVKPFISLTKKIGQRKESNYYSKTKRKISPMEPIPWVCHDKFCFKECLGKITYGINTLEERQN
jgi:hypothetical protein